MSRQTLAELAGTLEKRLEVERELVELKKGDHNSYVLCGARMAESILGEVLEALTPHIAHEREQAAEQERLREALLRAKEHLEYCGYGDKWERGCAFEAKLPQFIDAALAAPPPANEPPAPKGSDDKD